VTVHRVALSRSRFAPEVPLKTPNSR
jgi:hypothetical protein